MTASSKSRPKVRLMLKSLTFVTNEREVERGPDEQGLMVDREVIQNMVAWATAEGWRNPDRSILLRHLPRPAVSSFVTTLRGALAAESTALTAPSVSRTRMTTQGQMRSFFAMPKNRKMLLQVLDFLGSGGELDVEGA